MDESSTDQERFESTAENAVIERADRIILDPPRARVLCAPVGAPYEISDLLNSDGSAKPPWRDLIFDPAVGAAS